MESKVIYADVVFEKEVPTHKTDPIFKEVEGNKLNYTGEFGYLSNEEFKNRFKEFLKHLQKYKATGVAGYSILYGEVKEYKLEKGNIIEENKIR